MLALPQQQTCMCDTYQVGGSKSEKEALDKARQSEKRRMGKA